MLDNLRPLAAFTLCLAFLMLVTTNRAAGQQDGIIVVGPGGTGQFTTITQALRHANPGATIMVQPGTYVENLVIDKPVTLIGQGQPTVDGGGKGSVITVLANHTTITGFRIANTGSAISLESSAVKVIKSSRVEIKNNIISRALFGVYLQEASDSLVSSNTMLGLPEVDVNDRGLGIYLWNARNNKIIGNTVSHFKDGIYSDHSYSNLVANDIVEYGRYGVHLMYCSNYVIENVTSRSNIAGMALMYSENVTVRHNLVADNWGVVGYGIFTRAVDNLTLEDNLVYGNVYGILFYEDPYSPGNYALVRQNTIAFNYIGISLDDESAVSFSSNDIIENVEDVLRIGSASNSSTWDGNFWSSYLSSASSNRPVAVSDPVQDIVDGYPQLRLYMFSPAYLSLEAMMNALPAHAVVKAVDSHPSARPITQLSAKRSFSAAWFFVSTVIILAAVLAIVLARRPAARRRMPVEHD